MHLARKRYEYRTGTTTDVTVYTNKKEVSLYNNGNLVGTLKGEHVFKFKVKLEAENKLEVVAGELKDGATVYKTETPRPEYKVKKGKSQNWV